MSTNTYEEKVLLQTRAIRITETGTRKKIKRKKCLAKFIRQHYDSGRGSYFLYMYDDTKSAPLKYHLGQKYFCGVECGMHEVEKKAFLLTHREMRVYLAIILQNNTIVMEIDAKLDQSEGTFTVKWKKALKNHMQMKGKFPVLFNLTPEEENEHDYPNAYLRILAYAVTVTSTNDESPPRCLLRWTNSDIAGYLVLQNAVIQISLKTGPKYSMRLLKETDLDAVTTQLDECIRAPACPATPEPTTPTCSRGLLHSLACNCEVPAPEHDEEAESEPTHHCVSVKKSRFVSFRSQKKNLFEISPDSPPPVPQRNNAPKDQQHATRRPPRPVPTGQGRPRMKLKLGRSRSLPALNRLEREPLKLDDPIYGNTIMKMLFDSGRRDLVHYLPYSQYISPKEEIPKATGRPATAIGSSLTNHSAGNKYNKPLRPISDPRYSELILNYVDPGESNEDDVNNVRYVNEVVEKARETFMAEFVAGVYDQQIQLLRDTHKGCRIYTKIIDIVDQCYSSDVGHPLYRFLSLILRQEAHTIEDKLKISEPTRLQLGWALEPLEPRCSWEMGILPTWRNLAEALGLSAAMIDNIERLKHNFEEYVLKMTRGEVVMKYWEYLAQLDVLETYCPHPCDAANLVQILKDIDRQDLAREMEERLRIVVTNRKKKSAPPVPGKAKKKKVPTATLR